MQFPQEVAVTLAEAPDLGRLVPHDTPHPGAVIEVEPSDDVWLDGLLTEAGEEAVLLVFKAKPLFLFMHLLFQKIVEWPPKIPPKGGENYKPPSDL